LNRPNKGAFLVDYAQTNTANSLWRKREGFWRAEFRVKKHVAWLGNPVQRARPDGLVNIPSPGAPPMLDEMHEAFFFRRIVDQGPFLRPTYGALGGQ
jgi:hypothetical protein